MKLHTLNNIGNCNSVEQYIEKKLSVYRNSEKTFETLYKMMFSERNNTMAEQTVNFKNKKLTYGQCADIIDGLSLKITYALKDFAHDSIVGLYMTNSLEALQIFWAVLKSGYSLIFLNTSLPDDETNLHIKQNGVCAVISDSKQLSVPTFTPEELFSAAGEEKNINGWGNSVIFMSSGTSGAAKYCYYNAENFYHQIESTLSIVKRCPAIAEGYEGNLKILVLLPFSHIFGFTAVYLWFGFFARTFVFLKDTLPQTVQETVRNHKVTHIFAVPLVWEAIHRKALSKITKTGKRKTFDRLLAISLNGGFAGTAVRNYAMRKIREEIFGDSVKFLISGGCNINSESLVFFNGIGYHLANGYGLTETGISSVNLSDNIRLRCSGSVGEPFDCYEYKCTDTGRLQIKSKAMAYRIVKDNVTCNTDYDVFFDTCDVVRYSNGQYFIDGRCDDVIILTNGENVNPDTVEAKIPQEDTDGLCLIQDSTGSPVLIIFIRSGISPKSIERIKKRTEDALRRTVLAKTTVRIVFSTDIPDCANGRKLNRKNISAKYTLGTLSVTDIKSIEAKDCQTERELRQTVTSCFAKTLGRSESEISYTGNFFRDFSGSSIDYFDLLGRIREKFGIEIAKDDISLFSVRDFCKYLREQAED